MEGIETSALRSISRHLVGKTETAAFLGEVQNDAAAKTVYVAP
jgi:hypothetical protein